MRITLVLLLLMAAALAAQAPTTAQQYAALDIGRLPDAADPKTRQVDALFTRLEKRCAQKRDGRPGDAGLADMSVAGVKLLREDGQEMTYLQFLSLLDRTVPAVKPGGSMTYDCAPIVATLVVTLKK